MSMMGVRAKAIPIQMGRRAYPLMTVRAVEWRLQKIVAKRRWSQRAVCQPGRVLRWRGFPMSPLRVNLLPPVGQIAEVRRTWPVNHQPAVNLRSPDNGPQVASLQAIPRQVGSLMSQVGPMRVDDPVRLPNQLPLDSQAQDNN